MSFCSPTKKFGSFVIETAHPIFENAALATLANRLDNAYIRMLNEFSDQIYCNIGRMLSISIKHQDGISITPYNKAPANKKQANCYSCRMFTHIPVCGSLFLR